MARIVSKQLVTLFFTCAFFAAADQVILAAAPANDLRSEAMTVGIGFSQSWDTSEATTDADDTYWNGISGCNFPVTDASVWYQFVGTGETLRIEVFQSNYSASILISDRYTTFGCGIGGMDFGTAPGDTYYMMVLDDQRDGGGNGGTLNLSITLAPPPPPPSPTPDLTVTLGVSGFGSVNVHTGDATISGTYTCMNADSLHMQAFVVQEYGPFGASASNFDIVFEANCDGSLHTWSALLYPPGLPERRLHGGRGVTAGLAYSSGQYGNSPPIEVGEQDIILRGR
jgi:hypothetical protein